jgi:hypothetical protein
MLDMAGAALASTANLQNKYLLSLNVNPVKAAAKASWNVAIQGAFTLLYPMIHLNFPNRIETTAAWVESNAAMFIYTASVTAMYDSLVMHTHEVVSLGAQTLVPVTPPIIAPDMAVFLSNEMVIPSEIFVPIVSRPIPLPLTDIAGILTGAVGDLVDMELGVPTMEPMAVWALSPVNALIAVNQ